MYRGSPDSTIFVSPRTCNMQKPYFKIIKVNYDSVRCYREEALENSKKCWAEETWFFFSKAAVQNLLKFVQNSKIPPSKKPHFKIMLHISGNLYYTTVVLSCGSERKKVHGIWPSPSLNTIFSELEIKKIEMF